MPVKKSRTRARKPYGVSEPVPTRVYQWWLWSGQPTFEGVCDALAQQYAVLDGLLQPLLTGSPAAAGKDRWRVALGLAHLSAVADQVLAAAQEPPGPPSGLTAVDWYRRRDPDHAKAGAEAVARSQAARVMRAGIHDLAMRHRSATATAIAVLRSGEPGRILGGPAEGLELAEFTLTRLVEAVVHGLDLADALGRPGTADPASTNLVSGFLAVVADRADGETHSAPISVDGQGSLIALSTDRRMTRIPAVDWIRLATGRSPAGNLLPASHDWLTADLPLVA